ncbi:MAG: cytochrome c oxidase assembly protein [Microthrixaceae bacterium]
MAWWCSALERPWDWTPRPYLGVWLLCLATIAGVALAWRRHDGSPTRRQRLQFAGGIAALWIASDWPVGALGGAYLSSVHMLQYMLYTLAAAPLLMLATPEWMATAVLERLRTRRLWELASRPLLAALSANVVLVTTHSPFAVDLLRSTQAGSFVLDMVWLLSGFLLWAPIINPVRELRMTSAPMKITYLFVAAALIPMIPGGFLAFAPHPLYSTYELAPRAGLGALADQQLAGVLMKVGNVPVIWAVMGVIWFRWYEADRQRPVRRTRTVRARPTPAANTAGSTPAG